MRKFNYRRALLSALVLFLAGIASLSAAAGQLSRTISLGKTRMSVEQVLEQVSKQSGLDIFYDYDELNPRREVTLPAEEMTLEALLNLVLGSQYGYQTDGNTIVISRANTAQQPAGTVSITGRVTDQAGNPLTGVTVMIKFSTRGTITDAEGRYTLRFTDGRYADAEPVVVFSMVGMTTREIEYSGQETIDIRLQENVHGIEEVVVTGYGEMDRRKSTSSIETVKVEDIDIPSTPSTRCWKAVCRASSSPRHRGSPAPRHVCACVEHRLSSGTRVHCLWSTASFRPTP